MVALEAPHRVRGYRIADALVAVPTQVIRPVDEARETAARIGAPIVEAGSALLDREALTAARREKYKLIVDPVDIPTSPGIYWINYERLTLHRVMIEDPAVLTALERGLIVSNVEVNGTVANAFEVVRIYPSAVATALEGRPVVLDPGIDGVRNMISLLDWRDYGIDVIGHYECRVAVPSESLPKYAHYNARLDSPAEIMVTMPDGKVLSDVIVPSEARIIVIRRQDIE